MFGTKQTIDLGKVKSSLGTEGYEAFLKEYIRNKIEGEIPGIADIPGLPQYIQDQIDATICKTIKSTAIDESAKELNQIIEDRIKKWQSTKKDRINNQDRQEEWKGITEADCKTPSVGDCFVEDYFQYTLQQMLEYTLDTTVDDDSEETHQLSHEAVAKRVIRRNFLRHAQIRLLTRLAGNHIKEIDKIRVLSLSDYERLDMIDLFMTDKDGKGKPNDTLWFAPAKEIWQKEIDVKRKAAEAAVKEIKAQKKGMKGGSAATGALSEEYVTSKANTTFLFSPELRAYRLAITDIFVEKALTYLEIQANKYSNKGERAYNIGLRFIIVSIVCAAAQFGLSMVPTFQKMVSPEKLYARQFMDHVLPVDGWYDVIHGFTIGFTFYGLIVLAAVGAWRYGKAMMDQAERLMEKRHALREGRLFVHLRDGLVSIEDMERAFNWNVTQPNAFGGMPTEAKAPWGAAFSDLFKFPELAKKLKGLLKSTARKEI